MLFTKHHRINKIITTFSVGIEVSSSRSSVALTAYGIFTMRLVRPSLMFDKVNIWSHLLGAVGFGVLAGVASNTYLQRYPTSSYADIAVFSCFFGGAVTCLTMSASVLPPFHG